MLKAIEKTPVWIWVQDLWPETLVGTGMVRSAFLLKLTDRLVRWIYSKCDQVLVQSQAFVPRMVKKGVPKERIRFFPNSAQDLYKPIVVDPEAPERNLMPRGFRVLFAGNIGRAQDIPTILAAAEKLKQEKDIHWVILGDGPMRSWAEERIRACGLEKTVHLLGRYPEQSMPRFFSLADVLLVTLRKDPVFAITIPSKIQSYLACGRPIVASLDGEGSRVVNESGGGVAVPAGDVDALAEVVLKMYGMPKSDLESMGQLSRRYSQSHFERNSLLDRLDRWIKEEVGT
jgi:glycosyltransferase involved in cell wall biosynthesis